jgi:hypothetical protein
VVPPLPPPLAQCRVYECIISTNAIKSPGHLSSSIPRQSGQSNPTQPTPVEPASECHRNIYVRKVVVKRNQKKRVHCAPSKPSRPNACQIKKPQSEKEKKRKKARHPTHPKRKEIKTNKGKRKKNWEKKNIKHERSTILLCTKPPASVKTGGRLSNFIIKQNHAHPKKIKKTIKNQIALPSPRNSWHSSG